MNPGGVRSDLTYAQSQTPPEGDGVVTYGEAFTFQPFGNTLVTFPMTGAQIVSVLEEQCQPTGRAARSCTSACPRASPTTSPRRSSRVTAPR